MYADIIFSYIYLMRILMGQNHLKLYLIILYCFRKKKKNTVYGYLHHLIVKDVL